MSWLCRTLVVAIALLVTGCRDEILHNLDERDANRVITRLAQVKIAAYRERQPDGRWTVAVDKSAAGAALQLLETSRVLRSPDPSALSETKPTLLSSREEQQFLFERSVSREIEGTLGTVEGVLEARVHLNLPPRDPLFGERRKDSRSSASVLLITAESYRSQSEEVAALVAGASGIAKESVHVMIVRATEVANSHGGQQSVAIPNHEGWFDALTTRLRHHSLMVQLACSLLVVGVFAISFSRRRKHELRPLHPSSEVQ